MLIRDAKNSDAKVIALLLGQLGYTKTPEFIGENLAKTNNRDDYKNIVCVKEYQVIAFITLHFSVQIGYKGEILTITYFVVDERYRSQGVGSLMEQYCVNLALKRNCAYIDLYSNIKRLDAHRFYERQGYKAYEKYFMKQICEEI